MTIYEIIENELSKIQCADGLTIDNIKLNSDLGKKLIFNVASELYQIGREEGAKEVTEL